MADTFFDFDTTINNDGNLLCGDECTEAEEYEYDALNDETFGTLGDDTTEQDDWEQQHEQLAEIAESNKHSEHLENSISQLVLDDSDDSLPSIKDYTDWSYQAPQKNGDIFNSSLLSSLQKTVSSNSPFIDMPSKLLGKQTISAPPLSSPLITGNQLPKKICTVEELERGLRPQKLQQLHQPHQAAPQKLPMHGIPTNIPPPTNHPYLQHQHQQGLSHVPPRLPPPGLHHPMGMPPGMRHLPPGLPPGFTGLLPPHHPGFRLMFPNNNLQFPMNHPYGFPPPPPPRNVNPGGQPIMRPHNHQMQHQPPMPQQQQQVHQNRHMPNPGRNKTDEAIRDEYVGLMTNREKQWLLNIQQLQLNTGTPYFDDYYYTVFKERKAKNNKENQPNPDRNQRYNQRHNRNHQEHRQENTLQPRVYTPLQFENSLGKLQCGSVTAPRKIIDTDVVTLEKDSENPPPPRDTRKTKQLLLELEGLYSLVLRAEDLRNPLAIANMEKLVELKQKQRLRELEAAPTPEQKQEVLRLLQQESLPPADNHSDYLNRVMTGLMQEDKFTSYLNIRKGKMLLLRVLPHLTTDTFTGSFCELWMKVLMSLPMIGRKDTAGDNILPKLHPYFKRYIQTSKASDILEITSNLAEVMRPLENSRSTPLSHHGRAPLYFVVMNKFGVSALVTMLVRMEYLISSDNVTDKQLNDWSSFVLVWSELSSTEASAGKYNVASPVELIPRPVFVKHANRITRLSADKRQSLERHYVDVN